MVTDWFERNWPDPEGIGLRGSFAIRAIWSPPLSEIDDLSPEERSNWERSLGFDLEIAVNSALAATLGNTDLPRVEMHDVAMGPAAEGLIFEFFVVIREHQSELTSILAALADAYVATEVLGRVKKHFRELENDKGWKDRPTAELSFTPDALARACEWHVRRNHEDVGPFIHRVTVMAEPELIVNLPERLQYKIELTGQQTHMFHLDATGTILGYTVNNMESTTPDTSIIPDVSEWPVRKPLDRDWTTGELTVRWPTQDGTDRLSHIAIVAILDPKFDDPDGHIRDWEFVNRAGEIERLVRDQFDKAVKAAIVEVLNPASTDLTEVIAVEHYQVGPADGGLIGIEHYLATLADSRESLLALLGLIADGWAVYEIVRRARRKLNVWIAGFGDARLAVSLSFPPATLCLLCEEHVRRNYHPRAHLTSEWYCLTQEFFAGYVSPGHPTETVEYLILVSTREETYRFRLWGSGIVAAHSVRRGRLDADLPLPDLLEAKESTDG